MRHTTAGDDQATGDDITTHAGAEQAAEQSTEEGVLEKGVREYGEHLEKRVVISGEGRCGARRRGG